MGLQPVEKTIDGEVYTFTYLPPRISLALLTKIIKLIGPAIGAMTEGKKDTSVEDLDIGKAAKMLCEGLDENETQFIIDSLLTQITHKGLGSVSRSYDAIFTGRLKHLFLVVKAALEVQYADFFEGKNVMDGIQDLVKGSTLA